MDLSFKSKVHDSCQDMVSKQILGVQSALKEAQNAANNETKSSAGDKHETGRAMAQLETEKLTTQLTEALKTKEVLDRINYSETSEEVKLGSLVLTNKGIFYISIGLGKVLTERETIFAISIVSPIGKLLLNKKEKESFSFNGNAFNIEKVI